MEDYAVGSHDFGDPSTTNIFLGSINPKVSTKSIYRNYAFQNLLSQGDFYSYCVGKIIQIILIFQVFNVK